MMLRSSSSVRMVALSVLLLALLLQGCGRAVHDPAGESNDPSVNHETPSDPGGEAFAVDKATYKPEDTDPQIAEAQMAFAFDLFREISGAEPGDNHLLSPVSIATALAMTVGGANGETRDEMLRMLYLEGLSDDQRNKGHKVQLDLLRHSGEEARVLIANSLWGNEDVTFKEPFLQTVKSSFDAQLESLDMGSPEAPDTINAWVREHTNERIDGIVEPPLDPDTLLYLINAVYLDANWAYPFDEEATTRRPFTGSDGQTADVEMMHMNHQLDHLQADGFQAVRLPYEGHLLSMYVFLPDETLGLSGMMEQLEPAAWKSWLDQFEPSLGDLRLPRFAVEDEFSLIEPLRALGMNAAFERAEADFSLLSDLPVNVYVHEARHKAMIEVTEKGTIAAAVTSIGMMPTSAPSDSFEMEVNRPFFYAIVDERTDSILFMGTVGSIQ
ncbi:serpin family protein [Paenibacillus sp. 1P07SE]|uniref:serpin family protein n=1 Tax=Paenibacillus sp. 1P07SE TaxID=3132209 RepID=UPI0039A4E01D